VARTDHNFSQQVRSIVYAVSFAPLGRYIAPLHLAAVISLRWTVSRLSDKQLRLQSDVMRYALAGDFRTRIGRTRIQCK